MKRLSLQWRITLLTALLIACACFYTAPELPAWMPSMAL